MYIVAEYLFLENFIINYLILYITKTITRTKVKKKRVFLTGILAALYPFVFFFDSTIILTNFYMKILISLIIVKLAYNSKNLKLYLKQLASFYLISFVFGGATLGFYYFSNNYIDILFNENILKKVFPAKYLILGISFGGILIINILEYYYEKISKEEFILDISISLNNKKIKIKGLIDTGNSLIDPLSKSPVLIADHDQIKNLLPEDINNMFKENREEDFIYLEEIIRKFDEEINIRLIPFKSVGKSNGILIGFMPDYITISREDEESLYNDLVIGIFNGKLSADGQYNALLNEEILNRGDLYVNEN